MLKKHELSGTLDYSSHHKAHASNSAKTFYSCNNCRICRFARSMLSLSIDFKYIFISDVDLSNVTSWFMK